MEQEQLFVKESLAAIPFVIIFDLVMMTTKHTKRSICRPSL